MCMYACMRHYIVRGAIREFAKHLRDIYSF